MSSALRGVSFLRKPDEAKRTTSRKRTSRYSHSLEKLCKIWQTSDEFPVSKIRNIISSTIYYETEVKGSSWISYTVVCFKNLCKMFFIVWFSMNFVFQVPLHFFKGAELTRQGMTVIGKKNFLQDSLQRELLGLQRTAIFWRETDRAHPLKLNMVHERLVYHMYWRIKCVLDRCTGEAARSPHYKWG